MITEAQFLELKKEYEDAMAAASRAKGAYDQLRERLRTDFGCDSLEDAQKKLRKLRESIEATEQEFNDALEAYQKKWTPHD